MESHVLTICSYFAAIFSHLFCLDELVSVNLTWMRSSLERGSGYPITDTATVWQGNLQGTSPMKKSHCVLRFLLCSPSPIAALNSGTAFIYAVFLLLFWKPEKHSMEGGNSTAATALALGFQYSLVDKRSKPGTLST